MNVYANTNHLMAYYMNNEENRPRHKGSVSGHKVIYRGRAEAERNLLVDYFAENPRYDEAMFRRRFRMSRSLFLRISLLLKIMTTILCNEKICVANSNCLVCKK